MKKSRRGFDLLVLIVMLASLWLTGGRSSPAQAAPAANDVRISQVYGGGGNSGAYYTHDFIELFNSGASTVSLTGWSVQYASSTGNFGTSDTTITPLSGSLLPGQYLLIQEAQGAGGTAPLPTPDITDGTAIAMSASNGKVALVNTATGLNCGGTTTPCTGATLASIIDLVGYGAATWYEGAGAAPALTNTTAGLRVDSGCTDTDNNSTDFSAAAPTPRNTSSPTHSCGDSAPFVSSTTPANGATSVALTANITVNFSEAVNAASGWYAISCTVSGAHTALVSGGPSSFTLDPNADLSNGDVCTVTLDHTKITDQDVVDPPDEMTADYEWSFSAVGAALPCSTIPLIQGTGNTSSCLGHRNNIVGCITGVTATGFYFQDETGDGNPASSDGIYAYYYSTWANPANLVPGDRVQVSGDVSEYYNTTEFAHKGSDPLSVTKAGTCTLPTAVTVAPIADPTADLMTLYERYEGMRVQMTFDGWVVGPTKRYASRYVNGDPEIAFVDFSSTIPDYSRVFQSDYTGYQGINYISGGLDFDLPDLDFGDRLAGTSISGILGYQFDKYTLLVDAAPMLTTVDQPDVETNQPAADASKREFDVCFYNVENLFDNLNDGSGDWGDWAPGYPTSGTPAGAAIYQTKLAKTAEVLVDKAKSCMVIGLEEMEGKQAVYNALAAALHSADPAHTWTAAYVESGDSRDISQGFLWREDVTLVGSVSGVSGAPYTTWVTDGALNFVRVPAMGVFRFFGGTATPVDVRLLGLHMKSKGSSASCSLPDCTDVREKEAADLRDILAHYQTAGEYAIAGGDYNDFFGSTPIAILDASPNIYALYYDLPANQRYSYIFSGESEVLDHIYITRNFFATAGATWSRSFEPVHTNTDFPASEHASDHDPVRVRFGFYVDNGSGSAGADLTDLTIGYDLAWHKGPHNLYLGSSVTDDVTFAQGDDNASDDGIVRVTPKWIPGQSATIRVTVGGSGNGWLSGWFDWDLSGAFDGDEKTINRGISPGSTLITFTVPLDAAIGSSTVQIPVRFRLYESATEPASRPDGAFAPEVSTTTGGVTGGEVEDYLWGYSPTVVTLRDFTTRPVGGWLAGATVVVGLAGLALAAARRKRRTAL